MMWVVKGIENMCDITARSYYDTRKYYLQEMHSLR